MRKQTSSGMWVFSIIVLALFLSAGGCKNGMVRTSVSAEQEPPTRVPPSAAFGKMWNDGKAELSSYDVVTTQYGEERRGSEVLIYVTEPMNRETWVKDDRGDVPKELRENVLKLNRVRRFQTGIYDYSVMTSVFGLIDRLDRERFAPVRITTTIQEWCGQTYFRMMPSRTGLVREIRSYFSHEGEKRDEISTPAGTVYEDGLFLQLRELDDVFADGKDWTGKIVPSYWNARKGKALPEPLDGSITRTGGELNGEPVEKFKVVFGDRELYMEIEKKAPKRILRWKTGDGETGEIKKTVRLPYWNLNGEGDETYLKQLDL